MANTDVFAALPEGWRPQAGDTIEGRIIDMEVGFSTYNSDNYPILILENEQGRTAVHCFHTTLKRAVMAKRVKPGELISITCGEKRPLKGNPNQSVVPYMVVLPERTANDFDADSFYGQLGTQLGNSAARLTGNGSDVPSNVADPEEDDLPF